MNTLRITYCAFIITLGFLFAACRDSSSGFHDQERDPKPYESVAVSTMNTQEILDHLDILSNEMSLATSNNEYGEMHHLEIALSKALNSLEDTLSYTERSNLASPIDTLKIIAVKIHEAGHDQNRAMAIKLEKSLKEKITELRRSVSVTVKDSEN